MSDALRPHMNAPRCSELKGFTPSHYSAVVCVQVRICNLQSLEWDIQSPDAGNIRSRAIYGIIVPFVRRTVDSAEVEAQCLNQLGSV